MCGVAWLVHGPGPDPVPETSHPARHNRVQKESDGSLGYRFVATNALIKGPKSSDAERTLERRVETTIAPDQLGGSVGAGKAKGFHQNLPRGVQPGSGLAVT